MTLATQLSIYNGACVAIGERILQPAAPGGTYSNENQESRRALDDVWARGGTAAYSNSVWVRRFTGGIVAVNATGTGWNGSGCVGGSSETITLPSGGPWYPLHGANSVNGGGSAVTSVTIPACDARFYSTTGPNYRPSIRIGGDSRLERHATRPAANDDYFVQLLKDAV